MNTETLATATTASTPDDSATRTRISIIVFALWGERHDVTITKERGWTRATCGRAESAKAFQGATAARDAVGPDELELHGVFGGRISIASPYEKKR